MFSLNKVNCEYIKLYNEKYSYTDFVFYLFMRIFFITFLGKEVLGAFISLAGLK